MAERSRRARVRPEHEGLVRMIRQIAAEEVELAAPRVGTVVDDAGGRVRVRVDGEEQERRAGFARSLGHRYPKGTKVRIERLRAGGRARGSYEEVVTGVISERTGKDAQVVSDDDIIDGTITGKSIGANAIGGGNIGADQIETRHIKNNAVDHNQIATDAVQARNIKANSITKGLLESGLAKQIDDAVTDTKLGNAISQVERKIPTDYLKSNALNGYATEDYVKRNAATNDDLKALERRLKDYVDSKTKGKDKEPRP